MLCSTTPVTWYAEISWSLVLKAERRGFSLKKMIFTLPELFSNWAACQEKVKSVLNGFNSRGL